MVITYSFAETPFGKVIIASTGKGICYLSFCASVHEGISSLQKTFPRAKIIRRADRLHTQALSAFMNKRRYGVNIRFHLKGTPFQLKVWHALLRIPFGTVTTYAKVARSIGSPKAFRAVGTAVGDNPVSLIIPCHRVIRSNGELGNYGWGSSMKQAILGWESAQRVFPII
jgi:AraC family transcriptional regulator of adaptative response/methylated-DNA-[protein]-cysteine methyltransferase